MGTERNKAARQRLVALAEAGCERPEMARERMTGACRTFVTSAMGNDLEVAAGKAFKFGTALRRIAYVLGLNYDELRFAMIHAMIYIDANPKATRDKLAEGVRDHLVDEGPATPETAMATVNVASKLGSLIGDLSLKHGWKEVVRSLDAAAAQVWQRRTDIDRVRLEKESKEKLNTLHGENDEAKRLAVLRADRAHGIDRGRRGSIPIPVTAVEVANEIKARYGATDERPAPFTWEDYIRGLTEGPETIINERLDQVNARPPVGPFPPASEDDDADIVITDLDTGRRSTYTPPVAADKTASRTFAADADGKVTIRRAQNAAQKPDSSYWCYGCRKYHGSDDTE